MNSASMATITGAMRHGMVTGWYPERRDSQTHWLEAAFKSLRGMSTRLSCGPSAS